MHTRYPYSKDSFSNYAMHLSAYFPQLWSYYDIIDPLPSATDHPGVDPV